MTRVLVSLYEQGDKPQNAVDFIKKHLDAPDEVDTDALKSEYLKLKEDNEKLKSKISNIEKEVT